MAGTTNNPFDSQLYLTPNQQDLLLAALASNTSNGKPNNFAGSPDVKPPRANAQMSPQQQQYNMESIDPNFFAPSQMDMEASGFAGFEESPYGDFLDAEGNFEFDNSEESGLLIDALPNDTPEGHDDDNTGDKRKSPSDDNDDVEGGGKRREGEDKTAKKPGRKPLTSEPTTKRKAQNRAAQRAFRERKEKHLKDLETKVAELEKSSDAANHENGLLRAQVQRLQTELREYRKRLSLNSGLGRSPPVASGLSALMGANGTNAANNNFMFEFPRFGTLPGSQIFDNGKPSMPALPQASPPSAVPGVLARENTLNRSVSPRTQANNSPRNTINSTTSPIARNPDASSFFNGSSLAATGSMFDTNSTPDAAQNGRSSIDSSSGQSRVFQFNSSVASVSNSNSPSTSSMSQFGQNSSCGTSPEPSHNSPGKSNDVNGSKDTSLKEGYVCHGNSEGELTFCEKLNMACGNPRNPVPRAMSKSNPPSAPATSKPPSNLNGIDYFASQNGGQFDPLLFGDYRESQAAVIGDGDFTGGFFNDAFPSFDFGSPLNVGDNNTSTQEGADDEVVPGEDPSQLLNCHKIWDKLASRQDFKDGTIDIDSLCSELRSKARCSESGVVVDHKDVEAALGRLPGSDLL